MIISPPFRHLTLFRDVFPFPSILFSLLFSVRELKGRRKVVEKGERNPPQLATGWSFRAQPQSKGPRLCLRKDPGLSRFRGEYSSFTTALGGKEGNSG